MELAIIITCAAVLVCACSLVLFRRRSRSRA
jgi:hypothetical protein